MATDSDSLSLALSLSLTLLLSYLLSYLFTYLLTYLPTYLLIYLHTYILTSIGISDQAFCIVERGANIRSWTSHSPVAFGSGGLNSIKAARA